MVILRLLLCALLVSPVVSFGQRKEYVELQRDIALLQDQVRSMQTSLNEKLAQLQVLVQQSTDASNKANTAVAVLDAGIRDRLRDQEKSVLGPVAGVGAKLDQFAEDFRALKESVSDMNARMGKLQLQIVDLGNAVKTMQAPPAPPAAGGAPGEGPPAGVSAEQLYQSAVRDRTSGNLDLAMQEFNDYMRFFPATELAPNAQFYAGMIHYDKGDMESAIKAFDLVLEKFPENNKTADAMYMKGMALLKSEQRNAAVQEFREVVKRFPRTDLADKSRERLKALGVSATAPASKSSTPKKRR
ncbi:MAG: outer membrane protein assembly factor BamD [Acidobacteria bacterium]|nr:outer membrane protein assembly factor BamD [Acidobacteriota bacterium]